MWGPDGEGPFPPCGSDHEGSDVGEPDGLEGDVGGGDEPQPPCPSAAADRLTRKQQASLERKARHDKRDRSREQRDREREEQKERDRERERERELKEMRDREAEMQQERKNMQLQRERVEFKAQMYEAQINRMQEEHERLLEELDRERNCHREDREALIRETELIFSRLPPEDLTRRDGIDGGHGRRSTRGEASAWTARGHARTGSRSPAPEDPTNPAEARVLYVSAPATTVGHPIVTSTPATSLMRREGPRLLKPDLGEPDLGRADTSMTDARPVLQCNRAAWPTGEPPQEGAGPRHPGPAQLGR